MKNSSSFRLISIGFLSGMLVSGIVFLIIFSLRNHQVQKAVIISTPIAITESKQNPQYSGTKKIDLNTATQKELVLLPGIGDSKAFAIIDFRNKYGNFEEISELSFVPGIGDALLKSIQDLVIIN